MLINKKVLMSGADYFDNADAINAYMDDHVLVDTNKAIREHDSIVNAFEQAGIEVLRVPAPDNCQDGVYTANWALVINGRAIRANLPPSRQAEQPYAEKYLAELGYTIEKIPDELMFSGQGDALPCGQYLFCGTGYRTSKEVHSILADKTGLNVVSLQTIPQLDDQNNPVVNPVSGWPDSFFYDLDLAISVIAPDCIAWCPEAFDEASQIKIRNINDLNKIEVSFDEALNSSACNLVSTGQTVIMGSQAPKLRADLEAAGYDVIALDVTELLKGGGFIRCTSLTLG